MLRCPFHCLVRCRALKSFIHTMAAVFRAFVSCVTYIHCTGCQSTLKRGWEMYRDSVLVVLKGKNVAII